MYHIDEHAENGKNTIIKAQIIRQTSVSSKSYVTKLKASVYLIIKLQKR